MGVTDFSVVRSDELLDVLHGYGLAPEEHFRKPLRKLAERVPGWRASATGAAERFAISNVFPASVSRSPAIVDDGSPGVPQFPSEPRVFALAWIAASQLLLTKCQSGRPPPLRFPGGRYGQ